MINGEWASSIRRSVFVQEQGIDESEEWDEHDSVSTHVLAWLGDKPVGTARLLPEGKIGRMAVLPEFRSQGIGSAMLLALLANIFLIGLSGPRAPSTDLDRSWLVPEHFFS